MISNIDDLSYDHKTADREGQPNPFLDEEIKLDSEPIPKITSLIAYMITISVFIFILYSFLVLSKVVAEAVLI